MKVIGITVGNGVMVYPFKEHLIGNVETRTDYQTPNDIQWVLNFGKIPLYKVKPKLKKFRGADIIISHPTCGHSSMLAYSRGKKLGDGKADETVQLFIKSVKVIKPQCFLFENLTTLFKSFPENEFDREFKHYHLIKWNVSMADFGNSQVTRERLVIVGIRKYGTNLKIGDFRLNAPQRSTLKRVYQLEKGLEKENRHLCHMREADDKVVCMEKDFKKLNLKQIRAIWNSPEYKNRKKWDARTTGKGNMMNLPGVYRNLANDFPLTARKQNRQFNSKGYIMSPRELARIQGIPDSFRLWFDLDRDQYSINKARVTATKCPPFEVGQWFYNCIIKTQI